ncbi:hypothetical protein Tco_1180602 [Tanacetum coccineum]
MAEPNEYIFVTQKNILSDDNKGRMVEKSFLEIQGTFLVKIHDNTFSGIIGENVFQHIDNFLEVVGPLKTKGLKKFIQKFYQLSDDNEEMEADEDDDPDDIAEIFKIEDNLFDFETPLSKKEALMHKAIFEESCGDAAPIVMKFCAWLKSSFENFYELDNDVLVKLEECCWKVNSYENAPFARWENHGHGLYANAKTEKDYDPYLDNNRIFGRNYSANNAGNTQDNKKEHHDPSICNVRRFEMMKYSFDADDEYVAIKEREHSDHS